MNAQNELLEQLLSKIDGLGKQLNSTPPPKNVNY